MRLTDFTAISTKNSNIQAKKMQRAKGQDCAHILFAIIPLTGSL